MLSAKEMNFRLQSDYHMISDPPLIADIGQFEIDFQNIDVDIKVRTRFEEGVLGMDLNYLDMNMDPISIIFDGMSDSSEILTNNLNFVANVVRDRFISISKYKGLRREFQRINQILNVVLSLIPDEFSISGF